MSDTYTEADLKEAVEAAIAKALEPYQNAAALEALAQSMEEIKAPLSAEIVSLQKAVDDATVRATKAESDYEALVQLLVEAEEAAKAEADKAERIEARKEAVKDIALDADYIAGRLEAWANLSDEVFGEMLEGWKAVSSKKVEAAAATTTTVPATTAMKASREDDGNDDMKDIREMMRFGLRGVDVRTV